jgi:hypothetical protein
MSGGSFLGEMKNLGISIGKDIVRESAPLVKDMLKAKIQKRLSADSGKGLYAANVGRGRGRGRVFYPGEMRTMDVQPGDRKATAEEIANRGKPSAQEMKLMKMMRGGAAIEDQQFSLSDVAKTGQRLFGRGLKEDAMGLYNEYGDAAMGAYNEYSDRIPMRIKMTAAQLRSLKKGGAIQINPAMIDEAGRYAMMLKPQAEAALNKALAHSKGIRVAKDHLEDLVDLKRGGSLMSSIAMRVAPMIVDKLVDSMVRKVGGAAIEDQQFSLSDVAKTGQRLFGKGMKEDAMGLYNEYGDDARAAYDTYSPGLRARVGMGMPIQTGSPYASHSNVYGMPMHPFIPTVNPFGHYAPL